MVNLDKTKRFLAKANAAGYGNENTQETTEPDHSHTITYSEGNWVFHDNYFGGEPFGGREVIFYKGKPIWMMVYYGRISDQKYQSSKVYRILKKALLKFPLNMPLRGPDYFSDGKWEYHNTTKGSFDDFTGEEIITLDSNIAYKATYQGGLVDQGENTGQN